MPRDDKSDYSIFSVLYFSIFRKRFGSLLLAKHIYFSISFSNLRAPNANTISKIILYDKSFDFSRLAQMSFQEKVVVSTDQCLVQKF